MRHATHFGASLSRRAILALLVFAFRKRGFSGQLLEADEYEVKAAMVFTLSKFVDWPQRKAGTPAAFLFGVMDADPLANELDKALRGKSVGGRPAVLRRLNGAEGAYECQMLFIGAAARKRFSGMAESLLKAGVLTVGEGDRFIDAGGVIALVVKDDRVQLEINLSAAQKAGFALSSRILRLATLRGVTGS